jgi:hypothetical protein
VTRVPGLIAVTWLNDSGAAHLVQDDAIAERREEADGGRAQHLLHGGGLSY